VVIDTGAFIAGVGILVGFDILSITFIWQMREKIGRDEIARQRAKEALDRTRTVKRDGGNTSDD